MQGVAFFSEKFCSKCKTVTKWNSHNRCLTCQRVRSKQYAQRKKAAGGGFPTEVKRKLIAENPDRCPRCGSLWIEIPKHKQHPNTPWHFDHILSPQKGGLSTKENAAIICWPCNLKKLNK